MPSDLRSGRALPLGLLARLAWRNLWRHPRRTLTILTALSLAVWAMTFMASLIRGSMEQQVLNSLRNFTGHIQIHAPGYRDDPVLDFRFPAPQPALEAVLAAPPVSGWTARLRVPAVITSERESAGVTLAGIDPEGERGLSFIAGAVTTGRPLRSPEDEGVVIGRKLAERLETGLGRRVVLMSQGATGQIADRGFRVVGLFQTSPKAAESEYVFVGRATAQRLLRLGAEVSEIEVVTDDRNRLDGLVARLRAQAPELDIQPWMALQPLLVLTESVTDGLLMFWYGIVFLAISFGLINTLLMAVFERTREFGLVQALGMSPPLILGQVLLEALMLLLVALVGGNLLFWATYVWVGEGIDLSAFAEGFELAGISPIIVPAASLLDFVTANLFVFVLGLAASLYPAWRAARQVPVEAITRA